ncbi:ribosome small subunit-dependent GTPase A [Kineococcus sp. NUM-3379]
MEALQEPGGTSGQPDTVLARYGWDGTWAAVWEATCASAPGAGLPRRVPGRVARRDRDACDVLTASGTVRAAVPAALAADPSTAPATGDWVALGDGAGSGPRLEAVLPRRSALLRPDTGGRSLPQVLAANVDVVLVTVPLDVRLRLGRVERLLTLAWDSGARPVVVLTKTDLVDDPAPEVEEVAAAAPGADVVAVSTLTGQGLAGLAAAVTGTAVLVGPSGAGKSSVANALLGYDAVAVGAVRGVDGKGRHTSVRRELLPLPGGGVLVDTPGLRAVGVPEGADGLARTFSDVTDLVAGCRFADCGHTVEPGCAVLEAVADGGLPQRRLDSYRRLQREEAHTAARTDQRLRTEQLRRWKTIAREQRRLRGERGR